MPRVEYAPNSNVTQPRQVISSNYPDNLFMRNLSVGFYHALGNADDLEERYNPSSYRFRGVNLYGGAANLQGGRLSWRPRTISGPSRDVAEMYGIGGDVSTGRGGGASWNEDGLDGESIKKDILPTVAFHRRGNLDNLWKPAGRLGWGEASNPLERAKSYVWKQMNGPSGWESNDPPPADAWGFGAEYLNLIRERSKFGDTTEAARLLRDFMAQVGANQLGFGGLSSDSNQETILRAMPYMRQYITSRGNIDLRDLETAVGQLVGTPSEARGTTGYDLHSDMAGWRELEAAIQGRVSSIQGNFTGVEDFVEVTEQDQRIAGSISSNLNLGAQSSRDLIAEFMQREIDAAMRLAVDRGQALPSATHPGFAGQATRRMQNAFNNQGTLRHTWLEPVAGGIGIYNVAVPYGQPSVVSVSFLPSNVDLTRLVTGIGSRSAINTLARDVTNATYELGWEYSNIAYGATSLKTLMGSLLGDTRTGGGGRIGADDFHGILQTRGVVMTEGDLTDAVMEFVTGFGLALHTSQARATTTSHSSQFSQWAQGAVSSIARYGQQQATRLVTDNYQSWVRDSLTMGTEREGPNKGEPVPYGDQGSRALFTNRFSMNRLYQPKPFLWLGMSGVQERARFKANIRRQGAFQ